MKQQMQKTRLNRFESAWVPLNQVRIEDSFWSEYIRLVREVVVPYQWEALNDRVPGAEPSHAIRNFKIAAGDEQGEFGGMVFQDSDVAKWLEAVGYLLSSKPDPDLELLADEVIELIAKAQHADGYLNTYFTLKEPGRRWTNLTECHELYCAGHMFEAAIAYYEATGKRKILDVVCRFADYIDSVFGAEPGKLAGYDGHQEIELALVKLYRVTGDDRYLELSRFFLNQRGTEPYFYKEEFNQRGGQVHFPQLDMAHDLCYSQAHMPIREQQTVEGHAVRAVYMLSAMVDVAGETGDEALWNACRRMWRNIVSRRMYITGGIGSKAYGESFTTDYDLPVDTAYAETCASIGLIFFASRMLRMEPSSEYADVLERALYNTVVSGMSRDGQHFFYVNPLEVRPHLCGINPSYDHVKPVRQGWFGCACCPPNIARLLASLGSYIYTWQQRTIYTHLYIGGQVDWQLDGEHIIIRQHSDYAWNGKVRFHLTVKKPTGFTWALRLPVWCGGKVEVLLNGKHHRFDESAVEAGYLKIDRVWEDGDVLELAFAMDVQRMKGHPLVPATAGKVALQRGPFVYCMEEADNGPHLHQIVLPRDSELSARFEPDLLGGVVVIEAPIKRYSSEQWGDELYREEDQEGEQGRSAQAMFVPYFTWANRGIGEMSVWIRDA